MNLDAGTVAMAGGIALALVVMFLVSLRGRFGAEDEPIVHVDDLAVGELPGVCAVTGVPTTNRVQVTSSRGGPRAWWILLLFLGPIGIAAVALLVVLGSRAERIGGIVPISVEAIERYNAVARTARSAAAGAAVVFVAGSVLAIITRPSDAVLIGAAVLGGILLVTMLGGALVAPFRWIDLSIDASGRWVTVQRADPEFAAAVREHNRRHHGAAVSS